MAPSDLDLLRQYAHDGSQSAFAALVDRHLNLVYSAARRQVHSPQLAEEVAQSVFVDLAHQAKRFPSATPLVAWLHVVARRTAIDAIRRESRRQAREHQAAEIAACGEPVESAMKPSSSAWDAVEPLLDEAVESLNESDRAAILLRYFENKSLREVGAALGASEDAAQKRVSRAVEQLRGFFLRRGIAVTATGLATDLSAHAIASAPVRLSAAISTVTLHYTAALGTAKVFAMTTAQKSIAGIVVSVAVGAVLFEAHAVVTQRAELQSATQITNNLAAQLGRAREQGDGTARQLEETNRRLASLRAAAAAQPKPDPSAESEMKAWLQRVLRLRQLAVQTPEKTIPEMRLLNDEEWFKLGQDPNLRDEVALRALRGLSKGSFGVALSQAARAYVKAHDGQLPADVRELKPYIVDSDYSPKATDADDAIFARYAMRYTGPLNEVPADERGAVIVEISSTDEEHEQRAVSGPGGFGMPRFTDLTSDIKAALWAFAKAKPSTTPGNAADLLPYFRPPLSPARQARFLQNADTLLPR